MAIRRASEPLRTTISTPSCGTTPVKSRASLAKDVHRVPEAIDREIARLKLEAMGAAVDMLTEEQRKYLASWDMGT